MEQRWYATQITPPVLISVYALCSLLFIAGCMELVSWALALFKLILVCTSIALVIFAVQAWRNKNREQKALCCWCCIFMVHYWAWIFYAEFKNNNPYLFLFLGELLYFAIMTYYLTHKTHINALYNSYTMFLIKFFCFDFFIACLSSRRAYDDNFPGFFQQYNILHPLAYYPVMFLSLLQAWLILLYVVKFCDRKSPNDKLS